MATFQNQATLMYNGNVINSNVTTGQVVDVLSITKTSITDSYSVNDAVTYIISILNSATTAYSQLSVSNDLGAYTLNSTTLVPLSYINNSVQYYVNGILEPAPTVTVTTNLTISGINIPANGNAIIVYEASVNQFAPIDATDSITNTALLSGTGISTPLSASTTIYAATEANLTISKIVSPSTVTANGQINYTFIIQNYGNTAATAIDNAIVTDTFDPILTDLNVTFTSMGTTSSWVPGVNYTYSEATGTFTSATGQITVPQATYNQDTANGNWVISPGVSTISITGTLA